VRTAATYLTPGAAASAVRVAPAAYFTPRQGVTRAATTVAAVAHTGRALPATYYRWKDADGQPHLAQGPPPEGVTYSLIRALD